MRHILSVIVQNKPGVLSRISGLIRRKLFNIDSLTVGETENKKISRFTIVVSGTKEDAQKVAVQIQRLVDILSVEILPEDSTIIREIVLARFKIHNQKEESLLYDIDNIFIHEVYKKGNEICLEIVDTSQHLNVYLEKIKKSNIEILEWVRSGVIALKDHSQ